MGPVARRALLYGGAAPLFAALIYAGFVYETDPDLGTLLSSADVQLRLAMGMPQHDRDGTLLESRAALLDSAAGYLARAQAIDPQSPLVAEFQGFLCSQRGEFRAAAAHYRQARSLPGCPAEQRDTLVFNEARMLDAAGDAAAGLRVLTDNAAGLLPVYRTQCSIESAGMLHRLGREAEALQQLDAVMHSDEPMAWLQAGRLYAGMGRTAEAEAALQRAAASIPIADYDLARLKLAANDVDSSLRLLERVTKAAPAEVGRLLREDAAVWQALAEDARFRAIAGPGAATPGR